MIPRPPAPLALSPLVVLCLGLWPVGCATSVSTRPVDPTITASQVRRSVLTSPEPSAASRQVLRLLVLDELAARDPVAAIRRLERQRRAGGPAEATGSWRATEARLRLTMAELAIQAARDAEARSAAGLHLCAAYHAARILESTLASAAALDPTPRAAADLYNFAVARLVAELAARSFTAAPLVVGGPLEAYELRFGDIGRWSPHLFELLPTDEVEVEGLRNRFRRHGLGAPLVARRRQLPEQAKPERGFFAAYDHLYPLTARLRFPDPGAGDDGGPRAAVLDLHDPLAVEEADWQGLAVPLEADFTARLAILLDTFDVGSRDRLAAVRAERFLDRVGLYLLEPYRPDKIPLVLVHGFQASGATWRDLINDLQGDPELRRGYQVWLFNYPTGLPFTYSARLLRRSLDSTTAFLDPRREHGAGRRMVLVGHSMGGLVARLQVTSTGDVLWRALSRRSLEELDLAPADALLLREMYVFEPLPYVRRVVFVATPHRGSDLADSFVGRLGESLIRLPRDLVDLSERLEQQIGQALVPSPAGSDPDRRRPDNAGSLSPSDPLLRALQTLPIAPGVVYHTLVGDPDGSDGEDSDGVVPYWSAHLDGAASERRIPWGHNVHQHPAASAEIRRILREHLRQEP